MSPTHSHPPMGLIDFRERVALAEAGVTALALAGETVAHTCIRLGGGHPAVSRRDAAVRAYRRAASNAGMPGAIIRTKGWVK